jgi:RNA polymerase sigma factor FliA
MKKVSRSARDARVLECLSMVKAIASRIHANLPVHVDVDDLIQEGCIGLLDADVKFDSKRNVSLRSYAKHRVTGSILDSLRGLDWASRDMRRFQKAIDQAQLALGASLQRNPTEEEVADHLGVSLKKLRKNAAVVSSVTVSLSTRPSEYEDLPAPEAPSPEEHRQDSMVTEEDMSELFRVLRKSLHLKYWLVLLKYYWEEKTMKEIGQELGINEPRVSQMHKAALDKLGEVLFDMGIVRLSQLLK